MSYNVDSIEVLKCAAKMAAKDVRRLAKLDLAESNFLEDLADVEPDADGFVAINPKKFWWSGEGSGSTWGDAFIAKIAPKIVGTLEAVVTWEGGDSFTGLRIRNGKVTEPKVIMALAEEEP